MSHLEREIANQKRIKFVRVEEAEEEDDHYTPRTQSNDSDQTTTDDDDDDGATSSPWSTASSYTKSPWSNLTRTTRAQSNSHFTLMGSLLREDGHVYALAVRSGTLYTGSHSKNIRVWKNFHELGGFKSSSGFVKAIITTDARVFTAHHDGKVRAWTRDGKRVGTLPKLTDYLKSSINPNNYVEVIRRRHKVPKIKHYDAVSCLALNEDAGLLYSGSWDKTVKVWRLGDFKFMETINAHHDAINTVVVGFNGLLFSGSADGSLKVWRRRERRHLHLGTLLSGENAVTSMAVAGGSVLYSGSSDGLVNFWVREEEEEEMVYGGVLRGHKMGVLCLGTAGCMVMSGSADKTICVWRREGYFGKHSCIAVLNGHSGPVKCLAVEKDRYNDNDDHDDDCDDEDQRRRWIVYSGSLDRSVRIWRVLLEHASVHTQLHLSSTLRVSEE